MSLKPLLLSTLTIVQTLNHPSTLSSRHAKADISLFNNSDLKCHNTSTYPQTQSTLPKDTCIGLPAGGGGTMADPNGNRVGGSWGSLNSITGYETTDCEEAAWSISRKGDDSHFCELAGEKEEMFFAAVKGTIVEPKVDLTPLDVHDVPSVPPRED